MQVCWGRSVRAVPPPSPASGSRVGVGGSGHRHNPQQYAPAPEREDGANHSCSKPPSVGADAVAYPTLVSVTAGVRAQCLAAPLVNHRSPPLLTPWKTQCAQSIQSRLDARPWNGKALTKRGYGVVLALVPVLGNVLSLVPWLGCVLRVVAVPPPKRGPRLRPTHSHAGGPGGSDQPRWDRSG